MIGWHAIQGKYRGMSGFVIGGGPSLKTIELTGLKGHCVVKNRGVVIGVNKAYELTTLDFLFFKDHWFWNEFRSELTRLSCVKMCPARIRGKVKGLDPDVLRIPPSKNEKEVVPKSFASGVSMWNNAGVIALRIGYLLGLDPIYLLGIDLNQPGNFHDGYKDKAEDTTDKNMHEFLVAFLSTVGALKRKGVDVISCTEGSALNKHIRYQSLNEVLNTAGSVR